MNKIYISTAKIDNIHDDDDDDNGLERKTYRL